MTWHVHIGGLVQGVGFRPFVFLLAEQHGLSGWVNNTNDGVHIEFNGAEDSAQKFYNALLENLPPLARVTQHSIHAVEMKQFDNFRIVESDKATEPNLLLTPDIALCINCRSEIQDISDRRHGYAFTTCTHCGPRYSITHKLPYDRLHTTMDPFQMCSTCQNEYDNPRERRHYSQTNSCPECGVNLSLWAAKRQLISDNQDELIALTCQFWEEGRIVAIKGIGGYLLTCDATNPTVIRTLRQRKHRPAKPLALMYPDVEALESVAQVRSVERDAMSSIGAPIVLLHLKERNALTDLIAPGLNEIGVMLPYTPLYHLLLGKFGKPIVATSGNLSNAPIVFEDAVAHDELFSVADNLLINDRAILIPQDDSVVRFSQTHASRIVLRRSRGLAPTYINPQLEWPETRILATGAMLKSTFSFLHRKNTYVGQYLGDLQSFDTLENYRTVLDHFLKILNTTPELVCCDSHPEYPSTLLAGEIAERYQIPLVKIQHHLAHFAALLGEHSKLDSSDPILGVIWDGTGLGDDGQIWGGEFFLFQEYTFSRCHHFDYFAAILGDKMPREPRVSALSAAYSNENAKALLEPKFDPVEWKLYNRMLGKGQGLKTSSVGRIFDAVASLLGILDIQTYEGEAAMYLEAMARRYWTRHGVHGLSSYFETPEEFLKPRKTLIDAVVSAMRNGEKRPWIAANFHFSLVQLVRHEALRQDVKQIALSGGVFQNALLVDMLMENLRNEFQLMFHKDLSPNDENISFGQLVYFLIREKARN